MIEPMWRRPVVVVSREDGVLEASGLPPPIEPALGESNLDGDLEGLADADDEAIVVFARSHGLLRVAAASLLITELERLAPSLAPGMLAQMRSELGGLSRWIATGSVALIPPAAVPVAALTGAIAGAADSELSDIERVLAAPELAAEAVWPRVLLAAMAALDRFMQTGPAVTRLAQLEAQVEFRVEDRAVRGNLRRAAKLLEEVLRRAEASSWLAAPNPGSLRLVQALFAGVPHQPAFPLLNTESLADWRVAGAEMRTWRQALLLVGATDWDRFAGDRQRIIDELRVLSDAPALGPYSPSESSLNRDGFRQLLLALLQLRLQQEAVWPRPGVGVVVPVIGRALWRIWDRAASEALPRSCSWAACGALLPAGSRRDRRYCDNHRVKHRADLARARAARSYARRKGTAAEVSPATLSGDTAPAGE